VIYELHVRDFSINDPTVPAAHRGKYTAFGHAGSRGMRHLQMLSAAGMTDVHLLPVFDFATVPEAGCVTPDIAPPATPDSEAPQAAVSAAKERDCFNWGYDPLHYTAPEGSYATSAADGARRVIEFRQMVAALQRIGLRVGMDVVYNHTSASGQHDKSVLDRIVPGYYQRLNASGVVERSTCCDNTATENLMMGKLMVDSVVTWAREYGIDSFRFDLMGHQPRPVMEELKARLSVATGRDIQLIGEGWNFGEVAGGARFVQASQLSLNGSGIGTFSDRGRDAVRGGGAADNGEAMIRRQGYINGLVYDRNALAGADASAAELLRTADTVRVGLAGSLRDYPLMTYRDEIMPLARIDYAGQPAGYVSEPAEVVNYVENHDNQTLFDINVYRLPVTTSRADRARVQILGLAINAFSQGVAYFHAGGEMLRSKSLDRNSYDSGDWFNRLDWSGRDNYFSTGLPPKGDNGGDYPLMRPLLTNAAMRPTAADIAWTRDAFRDLLKIRASSTLFRLRTAQDIQSRLRFFNVGSRQIPTVLAAQLNGEGYPGAGFREMVYLINVDKVAHDIAAPEGKAKKFTLHPVHASSMAADQRVRREARYDVATRTFHVPPRSAVVFVRR
jgi:pullulanase-type alpha-1,6-glucosidase